MEMMHNRAVFMMLVVAVFIIYMISSSIGSGNRYVIRTGR
jgi:hypothetical protein